MGPLRVSVIIPTYNRSALLPRAIRSALAATAPDDEVIVVDDGSTDDSSRVVEEFLPRIRYICVDHGGAGAARNRGVMEASNPLVAFLDSDDEWMPDKIELQRKLMQERPDVLYCFSDFGVRTNKGEERRRCLASWHRDPRPWGEILGPGTPFSALAPLPTGREDFDVHVGDLYPALMEGGYVPTFTLVVRREAAGSALRFPEDVPYCEDWECFARLARAGRTAYLDCETAWQWGHDGPRITDANPLVRVSNRLKMLARVWGTDADFQARYGDRFRAAVAAHRQIRARWLLREGRTREAREELALAGGGSLACRVLAALPGPVARRLVALRRVILRGA